MWFWVAVVWVLWPAFLLNWLHHEFRERALQPPYTYIVGVGTQTIAFASYYALRTIYSPPVDPYHFLYIWLAIVAGTGFGNIMVYFLDWLRDVLKGKKSGEVEVSTLREDRHNAKAMAR